MKKSCGIILGIFLGLLYGKVSLELLHYIVDTFFDNGLIQIIAYMVGVIIIFGILLLLIKLLRFVIERI